MTPYERWVERLDKARKDHDKAHETATNAYWSVISLARSAGLTATEIHQATGTSETTIRKVLRDRGEDSRRITPPEEMEA